MSHDSGPDLPTLDQSDFKTETLADAERTQGRRVFLCVAGTAATIAVLTNLPDTEDNTSRNASMTQDQKDAEKIFELHGELMEAMAALRSEPTTENAERLERASKMLFLSSAITDQQPIFLAGVAMEMEDAPELTEAVPSANETEREYLLGCAQNQRRRISGLRLLALGELRKFAEILKVEHGEANEPPRALQAARERIDLGKEPQ